MPGRTSVAIGLVLGFVFGGAAGIFVGGGRPPPEEVVVVHASGATARANPSEPVRPTTPPRVAELRAPTPWPAEPLRWLAAAGGSTPESNQISIAQDLALAREILGPGGRVLFGAGAGSPSVQVLARPHADPGADPLRAALGDLFAPRGGRDATYRLAELDIDDAATHATVLAALRTAVTEGDDPLLVLLGGHGLAGETPRDNVVSLWGGRDLAVTDLAEVLDDARRPVLVVATTCFSGGLAELVFADLEPARGPAVTLRCGLFAAPWDLEASGCDPDPDRAAHEGYAVHWLHALRGEDRGGTALPSDAVDIDGDGTITALEAHTRVRLGADTADVPTTSSERWLRHAAPTSGRRLAAHLPEEHAVVQRLARKLDLEGREHEAAARLQTKQAAIDALATRLEAAQLDEDDRFRAAAADLLARWPVLDDPWHPEFAAALAAERDAVQLHLERSQTYAAYLDARRAVDEIGGEIWQLRLQAAPLERLARAVETIELAGRLRAAGGDGWATYEALLACERTTLPTR